MTDKDLISDDKICVNCVTPIKKKEVLLEIHDKEKAQNGEDNCIKEICPICRRGQLASLTEVTDLEVVRNAVRGFEIFRD